MIIVRNESYTIIITIQVKHINISVIHPLYSALWWNQKLLATVI